MTNELKDMLTSVIAEALQPIHTELKQLNSRVSGLEDEVKNIKLQLDENTQLTRAIFDRQEETDARIENISLDVHKAHGDITSIKEQLTDIQGEVEFTYHKTSRNEMELFKLKRDHA